MLMHAVLEQNCAHYSLDDIMELAIIRGQLSLL